MTTPEPPENNPRPLVPVEPQPQPPVIIETPVAAADDGAGGMVAEQFVSEELQKTRAALHRTRIVSSLLVLGLLGYLGYITATLSNALKPAAAAEIANGLIAERVEEQASTLSDDLKQRIPTLIADLPDYALKQLPDYREALEERIEADMTTHFSATSEQLGAHLEEFLTDHKDNIKEMLAVGADKEAVGMMGDDLEVEFLEYLKQKPEGSDESIQGKLDKTLEALQEIEKKMERLAHAGDLTPQEKKARRAIAILSGAIEAKRQQAQGI